MRVAVISDIHANFYALEAVLSAIEDEGGADAVWCLGDVVGYGPRPNRCCELVRASATLCLAGNHDLGVLGRLDLDEFSPDAAAAARWSQGVLEAGPKAFLEELEPSAERDDAQLFHGSPRNPVWEYVLTDEAAEASLLDTTAPVVLVGHSHVALAVALVDGDLTGGAAPAGTEVDLAAARWLLNPGSVGQPRDGDARAAHLLLDLDDRRATFRRTPYPIARTQAELRERGLPPTLADRLAHGI
jgi:predicted phosphodiesterase